jgi:excisionase family DNA binding protein
MQRTKPDATDATAPTAKPEAYRVGDVAERLSLAYRTIHRAIRTGRIKAIRCGGAVLIPRAEFERICEKGF